VPGESRARRRARLQLLAGLLSGFAGLVGGADLIAAGKVRVGSLTCLAGALAALLPLLVRRWRAGRGRAG
jgi:hypothetical protein